MRAWWQGVVEFIRQCRQGLRMAVELAAPQDRAVAALADGLARRRFASPQNPAVVGSVAGTRLRLRASTGYGKPTWHGEVLPDSHGSVASGIARWPWLMRVTFVVFTLVGLAIFLGSLAAFLVNRATGRGGGSLGGAVGGFVFLLVWTGLLCTLAAVFASDAQTDLDRLALWIRRVVAEAEATASKQ